MIGLILAAGAGRRLRPYTDTLPKALVPLDDNRSVMDLTLKNFAEAGLNDVAIIIGYAADQVRIRQQELEERYGVSIELVFNDKAEEWNNAYSLWCARDVLKAGAIIANGDTIHPVSVEELLKAQTDEFITLSLDNVKKLADEEMKVQLNDRGGVTLITKLMEPETAAGEYIGVARIPGTLAGDLADALQATFQRDPNLYYEDGFQVMVNRGAHIATAAIGDVPWIEVDTLEDLERAREIVCHY
jgi:choline kinase